MDTETEGMRSEDVEIIQSSHPASLRSSNTSLLNDSCAITVLDQKCLMLVFPHYPTDPNPTVLAGVFFHIVLSSNISETKGNA